MQFLQAFINFGRGSGPIFLDRLDCGSNDNTLLSCNRFSTLGLPGCNHERDVGVHCEGVSKMCENLSLQWRWVIFLKANFWASTSKLYSYVCKPANRQCQKYMGEECSIF